MPRPSKRNDLLTKGLDLVHRKGFSASGVAAISEAAAAPKGSFYNHFKSKDEFGRAILENYFEDVRAAMLEEAAEPARTGFESVLSYFKQLRNYNAKVGFERGCLIGNLSAEASQLSKATRFRAANLLQEWSAMLALLIAKGQADLSISKTVKPEAIGSILLDSWQGALLRSKVQGNADAQDNFIKLLLPLALRV